MMIVKIVILTRNNLQSTKKCIKSIRKNTKYPYEIIVVDSASTDGTIEYLRKLDCIKLLENKQNISVTKAFNQALSVAKDADYICKLDNDIYCMPNWLKNMINLMKINSNIGIVGAKLMYPDGKIQHAGGVLLPWKKWKFSHLTTDVPTHPCSWVTGACFLIKRDVIDTVGFFDEKYLFWFDDVDYCFTAREKGFTVMYCKESLLYHYTTPKFRLRPEIYFGNQLFLNKWAKKRKLWVNDTDFNTLKWVFHNDRNYFMNFILSYIWSKSSLMMKYSARSHS